MRPVILVLDNGPIHTSKATRAALAERAHWLTVEWLPKYAPELNDIEPTWRDLKRHHLAHQTFTGPVDLDRAIHVAVTKLNAERNGDPWPASEWLLSKSCHNRAEPGGIRGLCAPERLPGPPPAEAGTPPAPVSQEACQQQWMLPRNHTGHPR